MTFAGLRVKTPTGNVQIDNVNPNFVYRSKGSFSTAYLGGDTDCCIGSVTITARVPFVAIRSTAVHAASYLYPVGTDQWSLVVYSDTTTPQTIEYFVFDESDAVGTTATEGFRLWSPTTMKLCFASDQKMCKIAGVGGQADYTSPAMAGTSLPLDPSKTFAVVCAQVTYRWRWVYRFGVGPGTASYFHYDYRLGARFDGSDFTLGLVYFVNGGVRLGNPLGYGYGDYDNHQKQASFILVDVTGL